MHPRLQLTDGIGVVTGDFEIVDAGGFEDKLGRDDGEFRSRRRLNRIPRLQEPGTRPARLLHVVKRAPRLHRHRAQQVHRAVRAQIRVVLGDDDGIGNRSTLSGRSLREVGPLHRSPWPSDGPRLRTGARRGRRGCGWRRGNRSRSCRQHARR